jgi:hypothetical protein
MKDTKIDEFEKDTKIVINQLEWDELERRNEVPCKDCGKLTRGRIGEDPCCLDCALKVMMKPLQVVREFFQ